MQSKVESFLESLANVSLGYIIAVLSQLLIFPMFDIVTEFQDNLLIAFYFTLISLVRSYFIRRFFNTGIVSTLKRKVTRYNEK